MRMMILKVFLLHKQSKDSVSSRERRKRKKGGRAGHSATDRSSAGSGEVIAEASVFSASMVQS